jgi:hypothetical protein
MKISNSKFQIPNKSQLSKETKIPNKHRSRVSCAVWKLKFGAAKNLFEI